MSTFADLRTRRNQKSPFKTSDLLSATPSDLSVTSDVGLTSGRVNTEDQNHTQARMEHENLMSSDIPHSQSCDLPTQSEDDVPASLLADLSMESIPVTPPIKSSQLPWPPEVVSCPSKIFKPSKFVELCLDNRWPKRGRGVFSKYPKTIKPGVTILSTAPHVAVLETNILPLRCSSCFLEDEDFESCFDSDQSTRAHQIRRCTKCKVVAYCGGNCQRLDWASHKHECAALVNYAQIAEAMINASQKSKSRSGRSSNKDGIGFGEEGGDNPISRIPSAPVRALGRLIWNKRREEEKDPNWWKGLDELQSQLNVYTAAQKERLMQLSVTLSRYVGGQTLLDVLSSASALLPFCCRFLDNSFTLTSTTLDHIGVILCSSAAFLNHSCSPNAVVVFPEGGEGASKKAGKDWVKVVAIKAIEPGEEVVTSYVDLAGTRKERQNDLAQRYQFICECPVCKAEDPNEIDPREALKCPKCTNWFSLPSAKCNYHEGGQVPQPTSASQSFDSRASAMSTRVDAGPSSVGTVKKEISCPHCGFSRLIDVEGQRLAIKKSGQTLDPQKEPAKAAYYAEKAIEWFQIKLLPFTFGPGFYPILDLRRMKMVSHLMCRTEQSLKQATAETQHIISGVHLVYGVGHPVSIITKSTITKLCGWSWKATVKSGDSLFELRTLANKSDEESELGLKMLESLKQYQCLAIDECLIGFGMANGGGRLGRSIACSIQATKEEIAVRRQILASRGR